MSLGDVYSGAKYQIRVVSTARSAYAGTLVLSSIILCEAVNEISRAPDVYAVDDAMLTFGGMPRCDVASS